MPRPKKVIILLLSPSSFALRDVKILKKEFEVKLLIHKNTKGILYALELLTNVFRILGYFISGHRLIFSRFIDYHLLLPVLLSKIINLKVVTVIGGYEVNEIKLINYGGRIKKVRRAIIDFIIRNADSLLPVSELLAKRLSQIKGSNIGIQTIHNGFDPEFFKPLTRKKGRKDAILTLANISNERSYLLKGIDKIKNYAIANPHLTFVVVGVSKPMKYKFKNVNNFHGLSPIKHSDVVGLFNNYKYFILCSMSEGMPNVLCESILCGCVPISYDVGNAANIISNNKLILKDDTNEEFVETYRYASGLTLEEIDNLGGVVRDKYHIDKRADLLLIEIGKYYS